MNASEKLKLTSTAVIVLFLSGITAANVVFDDSNNVDFKTGVDMNQNTIQNLNTGSTSDSAATKGYVDTQATGSIGLPGVLDNDNTANQNIEMNGNTVKGLKNPGSTGDAVNLGYLNTYYLRKTTDSKLNGNLNMTGNNLTEVNTINGQKVEDLGGSTLQETLQKGNKVGGTAINFNESGSIQSAGVEALSFQADQDLVVPEGNLNMTGNNLTEVNTINGQDVSSLGGDGYIGNSGSHTAGGNLDMNGNELQNANASQSFQLPVGTDAY